MVWGRQKQGDGDGRPGVLNVKEFLVSNEDKGGKRTLGLDREEEEGASFFLEGWLLSIDGAKSARKTRRLP